MVSNNCDIFLSHTNSVRPFFHPAITSFWDVQEALFLVSLKKVTLARFGVLQDVAVYNFIILNGFALLVLGLIYLKIRQHSEFYLVEQKLFLLLVFFDAANIVLGTIIWPTNGTSHTFGWTFHMVLYTAYFALNPIPCMIWSLYADYQIHHDSSRLTRFFWRLFVPLAGYLILIIANIGYGFMFSVDLHNNYHRGPLFWIIPVTCYALLVFTFFVIISRRGRLRVEEYYSLLLFPLPPMVGGIVQWLHSGVSALWPGLTFSLLVVFINIMSSQLNVDHLTGLYNRRQLDVYLAERVRNRHADRLLAGIMIDLNDFKEINDQYGHAMGDQALELMGRLLQSSLRKEDFISRYGGDEFTVIMEITKEADLIQAVERIKANVDQYNLRPETPFPISFSIGYAVFDSRTGTSAHQFIRHIDQLMYADKKMHKCCE